MVMQSAISPHNQRELGKLILSIRANAERLDLFLAICDHPTLRDTLITQYEGALQGDGMATYRARLNPQEPSLKAALAALVPYNPPLQGAGRAVVTVLGGADLFGVRLSADKSEQEKFFFSLQWTREALREFRFPVVVWLSNPVATGVAQQAADFWSWRSGVFEFEPQPTPAFVPPELAQKTSPPAATAAASETDLAAAQTRAALAQQIAALPPESPLLTTLYRDLGDAHRQQSAQESA